MTRWLEDYALRVVGAFERWVGVVATLAVLVFTALAFLLTKR